MANLLTDSWRLGKVSLPSPMLPSPESTPRGNTSSLYSRGDPFPTRELLSFLQPGSDPLVQGVGAGWDQVSAVLSHHLPANRDPTATASGTGVGEGESTTAVQAETTGALGICQEMLTFPGPVFWPERPALRPLHTLWGFSLPVWPRFTTPALWRLQENERREGEREGRRERERETFVQKISRSLVSKKGEQEGGERASENERKTVKQARVSENESQREGAEGGTE